MKNSIIKASDYHSVSGAVEACNDAGGGKIVFSAGFYESATIHIESNTHLHFEEGAVLQAAQKGYDEPEDNPWDSYQDFGHSHFNNGLIVADNVENITISGPGRITGNGNLKAGDDAYGGYGDKLLVLKECRHVSIKDITLDQGGHFTILANGVNEFIIDNIKVNGQRDGANIINCKNVKIENSYFSGHDDALVFKSDYALGKKIDTENVLVRECTVHSNCNGLQFGTETVGAFRNMHFEKIHCSKAAKAAIGILSCDGSIIEDISFKDIILEECSTFFFLKIADRGRCPNYIEKIDTGIIRRIQFTNIEGRGPMKCRDMNVTPTIMGLPHRAIEDITFKNVNLTLPGGHPIEHADSYIEDSGFFLARFRNDCHPSYGWWIRDVKNITFENCSVRVTETDHRPAVVIEDSSGVLFKNFTASRSQEQDHDIRLAGNTNATIENSNSLVCIDPDSSKNNKFNYDHNTFKSFRLNKEEFSQAPFWFWNDDLDMDEIRRQILDFQSHGVHAFVIHPRAGLPKNLAWMSDKLLKYMRFAIEEASSRNMWVILYDEAMYPSGSSAGQVAAENQDYACRGLVQVDLTTAKPGETIQSVKISDSGIELNPRQNLIAEVIRQHDGHRIAIIDIPTESTIRGVHFTHENPERRDDHKEVNENHPLASDLLNPEAMKCFIRLVYQRFYDEFGDHFGKTIKAIFTDEPHLLGKGCTLDINPQPGTTDILKHVNAFLGYDFTPHLPALWDDKEPDAKLHCENYHKAIRNRFQETYYKPISDWCATHNIALTGHPAKSTDIDLLKYFQIPGQDVVIRYIEPNNNSALIGPHSTMAKCASSSMIHRGCRRNLNEFAGAYGHNLTFKEYRWLALWLLIRGCNMLVPHAFYYSTRGPRIDERPRDVGPNSPWWKDYKKFSEMTGKLCWVNTDSQHLCQIAILGQEDQLPWNSAKVCFENQFDFNYIEESQLADHATITPSGISIASMNYQILIIEEGYQPTKGSKVQKIVDELVQSKQVIFWEPNKGADILKKKIDAKISSDLNFSPQCQHLRIRRVIKEEEQYLIVFNEGETTYRGRLNLSNVSLATMINMDSNELTQWKPECELQLKAHDCIILIFNL